MTTSRLARIGLRLVTALVLAFVYVPIALIFVYGIPVFGARLTNYAENRTFSQAAAVAATVFVLVEAEKLLLSRNNRGKGEK